MGIKKTKKLMVLEKSETKSQFSMDDFPSKENMSTSANMPQEFDDCYSEFIQGSGETLDSQETISEPEIHSNVLDNQKLESDAVDKGILRVSCFHFRFQ